MDCKTLICETVLMPGEMSPEYVAAARAYARAVELLEQRREALLPLLVEEVRRDEVSLARIAREAGYTPQYVAKLARDAGVKPRAERTAPGRPKPAAESH